MQKGIKKEIIPVYIERPKDGLVGSESFLLSKENILNMDNLKRLEEAIK